VTLKSLPTRVEELDAQNVKMQSALMKIIRAGTKDDEYYGKTYNYYAMVAIETLRAINKEPVGDT
jgi:hypothetical protein